MGEIFDEVITEKLGCPIRDIEYVFFNQFSGDEKLDNNRLRFTLLDFLQDQYIFDPPNRSLSFRVDVYYGAAV